MRLGVLRAPLWVGAVTFASSLLGAGPALATDPVLRHQADARGNVVVFGSTLGYDCDSGIAPPAGATAACAGQAGLGDTAPDLYWRDNIANETITPLKARTSATLVLPEGAKVTYARLYWAGLNNAPDPDLNATLDWLGGPVQKITADAHWVESYGFAVHPDWYYYQASGDATEFISKWGAGDFRVTDVAALPIAGVAVDRAFSAWSLVVFYEKADEEFHNLALFDGFTPIDPGLMVPKAEVTLAGFLIPEGFNARMSAFGYEGDAAYTGDHFTVNGNKLSDAQNPADNYFNSSRSFLGQPVSGASDVPKLSGTPGPMAGYDLDTTDVSAYLKPGDTSCKVGADSTKDIFFLGGFVTSVISLAHDFSNVVKTVEDLNGGAVVKGDVLRYTIQATNTGNDPSTKTSLYDVIDPGFEFVPGSIAIVSGGAVGPKTDAVDADEAYYEPAERKITIRLGTGAEAMKGGEVAVGETFLITFDVTVAVDTGNIPNQGLLEAEGKSGIGNRQWLTDGDLNTDGAQPTVVVVAECDMNSQCPAEKPHCDPEKHVCTGCVTDADCLDPANPACQPSGLCGECSSSNKTLCVDPKPVCDTDVGICKLCTVGANGDASKCKDDPNGGICIDGMNGPHCGCSSDPDCGGPNSGRVCDTVNELCGDGCRGTGGNGCPDGLVCTSIDNTIGECVAPIPEPGDTGGCGCRVPTKDGSDMGAGAAGLFGALVLALRRRRRAS